MELIYLIRTAFASLFSFEFLNSVKILNFPLNFPWATLALLSFFVWISWEKFLKGRVDFPILIGGLFLFQLYANTFGNILRFYDKFNWYDRLTHLTGGATAGAVTFLALSYFNKKKRWKLDLKFLIIFGISLSLFFCVMYEFFEYFIDSTLGYNTVITDKYDTSRDLMFDLIGAGVVVLFLALILKKPLNNISYNESNKKI